MPVPEKNAKAIRRAGLVLLTIVVSRAFLLMLALGIVHLQWSASVPALGFWECMALSAAFAAVKR